MPNATYRVSILSRSNKRNSVQAASYGAGAVVTHCKSALAAASYRSGEALYDQKHQKTYDYSHKDDVVHTEILAPEAASDWVYDRQTLWNTVEAHERRVDSQVARSIILALPRELSIEENIDLVREHVQEQFVDLGMVADIAIHNKLASDGQEQPHAHILLTMRHLTKEGFGKKAREWNNLAHVATWRKAWEDTQNDYLARAGSEARIDMRSLAEQGIDRLPQIHLGEKAFYLKLKGDITRVDIENRRRKHMDGLKQFLPGYAPQLDPPAPLDVITLGIAQLSPEALQEHIDMADRGDAQPSDTWTPDADPDRPSFSDRIMGDQEDNYHER